ncbi:hypothetical protein [Helicobacter heilmannii]|nr:hypothetical protein [Helicobacter heilmannii]GMB94746.1 hypothetical protein NHP21011_08390 [Helicobacter heilmannii]CRF46610.1 hypothetical protein HHE014_16250 [Helicobacter heilmannii]
MRVFGSLFLEKMQGNKVCGNWSWEPANPEIKDVYASGANTNTRMSTYEAEKDNRSDSDKPNEGMLAV